MRHFVLTAILGITGASLGARADTLTTLDASQMAIGRLDRCFDSNFQPGRDAANDGGRSRKRLLQMCQEQWDTAAAACHANTGTPMPTCRKQTGALADAYLNIKNSGLH